MSAYMEGDGRSVARNDRVTDDDVLSDIVELLSPPRLEPGEFTVCQFAEEAGVTYSVAYRRLMKAVAKGILTKRRVLLERNTGWAFRKRDEERGNV